MAEEPAPPPPEEPGLPFTCERRDGSITEQWDAPTRTYRRFECGALARERPFTPAEDAWLQARTVEDTRRANRDQLGTRVRAALANNAAYLDKVQSGTATNADHIAQVPALARQMQGVIRILLGSDLLDTTGGSP